MEGLKGFTAVACVLGIGLVASTPGAALVKCPVAMKDGLWEASPKIAGCLMNNLNSYLHNREYIHKKK